MNETTVTKKKPFYGWAIAATGCLGNAIQGGFIFWTMGLYTSTFEDVFGGSRRSITLIETFLSVGVNLLSPLIGYLVDTRSTRNIIALGFASLGIGFILISMAGTIIHIYAVFIMLIPFGAFAIGAIPSSALITRWFRRRRGLALGVAVAGSSIGGAVAPILMTYLFIEYGWRNAMLGAGIAIVLLAPLVRRVLVNFPKDIGLQQEEDYAEEAKQVGKTDDYEWKFLDILKTPALWLQTLVSGSLLCVTLGLLANLSLHAKDLGVSPEHTALLYSTIAIFSFGGKIAFGNLTDRIGLKPTGFLSISLMSCSMLVFLSVDSYQGLLVAAVFAGLAIGGVTPIWTTMIARAFGARSFGRAMGIQNPLHIPITAPSAPLAGHISDTTGSYDLVFVIYLGLMAVAAIALYVLKNPQHRDATEPPRKL